MKKTGFQPTTLRIILVSVMLLVTAATIIIFLLVQQKLLKNINKTTETQIITSLTTSEAQALKLKINNMEPALEKLDNIAISTQNYQDQAIKDLNKYASLSGVTIDGGFSFSRPITMDITTQIVFGNIQSQPVVITLANPVPFDNFLKFIRLVEENIPLMQLTGINISRSQTSNTDIITDPITIEVLTK